MANALPFADQQDFQDAQRGFIASLPDLTILTETGTPFALGGDPVAMPNMNPWALALLSLALLGAGGWWFLRRRRLA